DPSQTAEFAIAYEDEHLVIVDKPAGVVVHPARGHWHGTLAQALEGRAAGGEDAYRAGIVHRLDRDTSGLLVVAKSEAVHAALKAFTHPATGEPVDVHSPLPPDLTAALERATVGA